MEQTKTFYDPSLSDPKWYSRIEAVKAVLLQFNKAIEIVIMVLNQEFFASLHIRIAKSLVRSKLW